MPKAAFFFLILLFSPLVTNSHAFTPTDILPTQNNENKIIFDSEIIDVNSSFFVENNFKRYLVFGGNSLNSDYEKINSLHQIQSNNGFFSISVLSEKSASNLISQGYHVIEDFKLDFHSEDIIQDASRIGKITGSSLSEKQK